MKASKIILGLFSVVILMAINSFVINVSAQQITPPCREKRRVDSLFFADSGKRVSEVHPGNRSRNNYQLIIVGAFVNSLEVIKEDYMTSLNLIPNGINTTSAKWAIEFAPQMGRMISKIKLTDKCTGGTKDYNLDARVKLLEG